MSATEVYDKCCPREQLTNQKVNLVMAQKLKRY